MSLDPNIKLEVEINREHLHAIWFSIKKTIEKGVSDTPQDEAFLLELLGEVARQDKNTKELFKLKLTYQKMRGAWFCCQIASDNKFFTSLAQNGIILQAYSLMAPVLNTYHLLNTHPSEIPPPSKEKIKAEKLKRKKTLFVIDGGGDESPLH